MKCTDYHSAYKEIEAKELQELTAALKAHGGKYVFIDCESEDADDNWEDTSENPDLVIVLGSRHWDDSYDDFYVSQVILSENGCISFYGFRSKWDSPSNEDEIDSIAFGQISNITAVIAATPEVQDVSLKPDNNA